MSWPNPETVPVAVWLRRATDLFGSDPLMWRFRCPVCGNCQTGTDFKRVGAEPQSVYQECIGRYLPKPATDLASKPGANGKKSPCDYAAYGLFRSGINVITESGKPVAVFPFDFDQEAA